MRPSAQDSVPHHHPIGQWLSEQEFRELLVAENVINHSGDAPDAFRRRAIGILREREKLFQRLAVATRSAPRACGVIEFSPTRELFDLRFSGRIFLTARQILRGEMKANATEMHPAGFARGERNFAPLRVVFALERKRLAGFHRCNHGGVCVFLGSHVDGASGIINYPGSLRLCQRRKGDRAGEENETDSVHLNKPSNHTRSLCFCIHSTAILAALPAVLLIPFAPLRKRNFDC